jgi:hypothetical protein
LCEGAPDFLAAHYLAVWEQASHYSKCDPQCVPVAILGASQWIHSEALPLFANKRIRIFTHVDDAGRRAATRWAAQLEAVGAEVDAFNFEGLVQLDGSPVQDLNDSLNMDPASFLEAQRLLP